MGVDSDSSDDEILRQKPSFSNQRPEPLADDELRAQLPLSFGSAQDTNVYTSNDQSTMNVPSGAKAHAAPSKRAGRAGGADSSGGDDAETEVGPLPPSSSRGAEDDEASSSSSSFSDDDDDDDDDDGYGLPVESKVSLCGHNRAVTALALDGPGVRLLSGGFDHIVRFWDFSGMDRTFQSFRQVEPYEGNAVLDLSYSPSGKYFVAATGNPQAKIFSRDGPVECEFVRGDMYLSDLRKTKGHVAALHGAKWDTTDENRVFSYGRDGTLRLWDVSDVPRQTRVFVARGRTSERNAITAASMFNSNQSFLFACIDGSLQSFDIRQHSVQPSKRIERAHTRGSHTSCLAFSRDDETFVTRGGDETMKVWDVRNLSDPVHVFEDLPNRYQTTDCLFSPDERVILTGSQGSVTAFDRYTFEPVGETAVCDGHAIRIVWNTRINQIFVGASDGNVYGLYSSSKSKHGVLLSLARKFNRVNKDVFEAPTLVITPHALPMFRDETPNQQRKRARKAPEGSKGTKGYGGRAGETLNAAWLKKRVPRNPPGQEDPRETIIRHAEAAAADPRFTSAYEKTQPKAIYDSTSAEQVAQEEEERKAKESKGLYDAKAFLGKRMM